MKFLSNRQFHDLVDALVYAKARLVEGQAIVEHQQHMLELAARNIASLERTNLEHLKQVQSLASIVLLVRANPEADIEADIDGILREVTDKVAIIEEHIS